MVEIMTPLHVVSVGQSEQRAAARILRKYSDQELTMADAMGLHLMTERRITSCWSTDRHLGLSGVKLVINEKN